MLGSTMAVATRHSDQAFFDPIIDVKRQISERYVESIDEKAIQALQDGAIAGMVEALNDPYTTFVPAAEAQKFNKDLTGEYVGIGASVNSQSGWLTIVSPLEDSPAFRAGILPDDRVVEIEGKSTFGVPVDECVDMLVGDRGTPVNLVIERDGKKIPFTIVRDRIKTRSVKGFHRSAGDASTWDYLIDPERKIGYVRLTQFTPGSAREVFDALAAAGATRGELKGLVLDVRYNPGGLLDEAVDIADMFLKEGVIVSTKGRAHPEEVRRARSRGTLPEFPIAVLINEQSASASEVLAGALADHDRAIVVGTRSFGKGSVQTLKKLEYGKGAELKLTEQAYYLPSGRSIHRKDDSASWGVDPTKGFFVPMTDEEEVAMLLARREQELLRAGPASTRADAPAGETNGGDGANAAHAEERWNDPSWVTERLKDKVLDAALRAVQGKIDTGAWQATGEEGILSEKIAIDELRTLITTRDAMTKDIVRLQRRIEAVEKAAADSKEPLVRDLWSGTPELRGGKVQVYDKAGALVATLNIEGNDLERWLQEADVSLPAAREEAQGASKDGASTKDEGSSTPEGKPETEGEPATQPEQPK
ncbi:MAG: S41 family peptidase [Planctomycetota bacterium]|nr:S41 family peptidase [Planctomycetota bacterium]